MDPNSSGLDPADFIESALRAVAACAGMDPAAQARRLAEDGLPGVLAPEGVGGLGLGLAFAAPVMQAAAAGPLEFPLLETLLLARALAAAAPEVAEGLVAGERLATIAWAGTVERGTIGGAPGMRAADLVLARMAEGAVLLAIDPAALAEIPGLDPEAPDVEMRVGAAAPLATLPASAWAELEADALVLRTAAMLGAAGRCIELAAEHVGTRRQFGRPLVAFQAVRHALARHKLGLEGIRGSLARSLAEGNARDLGIRRAAFAAACTHAPSIAEGALQLHGGMGFTWDIPVHRYLRCIRQWEAQGAAPAVREAIARDLVDAPYDFGAAA